MKAEQSEMRGRPRDPAVDSAILDATLALLEQDGYAKLSMESVASRAGVGKTSIYRRYADKAQLVAAAASRRENRSYPLGADSVPDGLVEAVRWLVEDVTKQKMPFLGAMFEGMRTDPALAARMRQVLDQDQESLVDGALASAIPGWDAIALQVRGCVAEVVTALIMRRALMNDEGDTDTFVTHVVDDIVRPLLAAHVRV